MILYIITDPDIHVIYRLRRNPSGMKTGILLWNREYRARLEIP